MLVWMPHLDEQTSFRQWLVWPDGYITKQSLAIYNNDNLPCIMKVPKSIQKFAKY